MKAFISYSSADREFARRLALDLKSNNVTVWLDEWEIRVGDEIRQKIEHGIIEYDYFVIVLSRRSVASTWVEKELNAAFMREVNTKSIVVLPAKIEDCKIPPLISGKKYADFTESYEYGLQELLKVLAPPRRFIPRKVSSSIIILDDDLSFARAAAESLRETGLSVSETYSLKAALELVKRYEPDAILLDVWYVVEGENALGLIKEIKDVCPNIRFIGLSSIHVVELHKEVLGIFDQILIKPVDIEELLAVLNP
jgi:CheY-like chemotaxis protein